MTAVDPRWGDWKTEPPDLEEAALRETLHCDVAVVGAGIAGVACALRAAQNGLKVIVLEKSAKWSAHGGNIGVPNSRLMREQGYENDPDALAREWIKRCGNRCDEEVLWQFLRNGEAAMDWLLDIVTLPEYGCRPVLQGCRYAGETYLACYGSHRIFDGPMARAGARAGAADAVYAMFGEAQKLGVEFRFLSPAYKLCRSGGRVSGVDAQDADGFFRVLARRGVVLATGDIGGNEAMCEDLAPIANRCAAKVYAPKGCNTGDGHRMGLWAGGAFEMTPFPTMIHPQAFFFANYCFLFVGPDGRRFMNEDNYIQGKGLALLRKNLTFAWSILDGGWAEKIPASLPYGGGLFWGRDHTTEEAPFSEEDTRAMLERGERSGLVIRADTPAALAEGMGVPPEVFADTLRRYNALAAKGHDDDFGKRPELLFPLDEPPYYALKFGPALLAVVGGLRVGPGMDVRDADGRTIPGLYAVGNAAGGRYGVDYPMLLVGNSHGTALTFGYLLGNLLADGTNP